jgi:hypothetical protein
MGIAQYFAVFGGSGFDQGNGASGTLNGALGSGTTTTLNSAFTVNGMRFTSDATTLQVAKDLTAAMADCSGRASQIELAVDYLDDLVLTPGVYSKPVYQMTLNKAKTLTLDARGDPNAVWIFNIGDDLDLKGTVLLINYPGSDVPVWWNMKYGIFLNPGSVIVGNIMAATTIDTDYNGAVSTGSLLALGSFTFRNGISVTSQARNYPNSYVGVIGKRIIVSCSFCDFVDFIVAQLLWTWAL